MCLISWSASDLKGTSFVFGYPLYSYNSCLHTLSSSLPYLSQSFLQSLSISHIIPLGEEEDTDSLHFNHVSSIYSWFNLLASINQLVFNLGLHVSIFSYTHVPSSYSYSVVIWPWTLILCFKLLSLPSERLYLSFSF